MIRQPVKSSNLKSVGYDLSNRILEIEFLSENRVYQYFNVPSYIHTSLIHAKSKGKYFNKFIRNEYNSTEI